MKETKEKLDCSPLEKSSRPVSYRSTHPIYRTLPSSELLSCALDENAQNAEIFFVTRNIDVIFEKSHSQGTVG